MSNRLRQAPESWTAPIGSMLPNSPAVTGEPPNFSSGPVPLVLSRKKALATSVDAVEPSVRTRRAGPARGTYPDGQRL
ncbi:hypothetical protein [Bradyrhizobium sp.]|uniref:hypothetical protein n=1 Tax=Bradyrhizobium sp. TaxID=376 RepID=UPI0026292C4F|nr:hypothetical protein [Bradyrhizobium sp.]